VNFSFSFVFAKFLNKEIKVFFLSSVNGNSSLTLFIKLACLCLATRVAFNTFGRECESKLPSNNSDKDSVALSSSP